MKLQTAISSLSLSILVAACGSTRTEMRPSAQPAPAPAVTQAPASANPAPAVGTAPAAAPARQLVAPGATGHVLTSLDDNDNLVLEVELEHLPPPGDLDSSLRTYVVWIRPLTGGQYQNVGQLALDSNRRGALTTTTPHADVDVIVTAEANATPPEPSRFTVLQGTAKRKS